ncbi:MAG: ABC transporter permease [Candidatus Aminicenantes bacterium]|nr:MAG: ABC transporter permease [Candidatus Aminicenantes bacterium]
MLNNYIKIALRNLRRNKLYSFLNIAGLAIGITCCILILLYVQDELSFDRFHEKADRIYRISSHFVLKDRVMNFASSAHVQGPMFKEEFPEVENYVRFNDYGSRRMIRYEDVTYAEERFIWVDNSVFDVFSFNLIKGNPKEALTKPNTVVITEEIAEKYFGDLDPIGKNLRVHNDELFMVTGVVENIPTNSHIRPDFLASFVTLDLQPTGNATADLVNNVDYYTYLLLEEGADYKALEQKLDGFVEKYLGPLIKSIGGSARYELQPLTSIYLYSNLENELERTGEMAYVWLFSGIGLFILLLACLNFMNLSTARSANRAKEVGLRKVVGAQRLQLIKQFIGESMILTFIAILLSLLLVFFTLPIFNSISGKNLAMSYLSNPMLILGLLGFFIVVSLIGGSYPAFFLSAFRPVEVLQGRLRRGAKSSVLRIALVSLQFTVSIVLIIGTLIVNKQLNYVRNKNLGYEKEHVIALRIRNEDTQKRHEAIRTALLTNPNILSVSASSSLPLGQNSFSAHHIAGQPADEMIMLHTQIVDEHFIDTYKMEIVQGRNFSKDFPTDPDEAIIINEATAKKLGWQDDPLGKEIEALMSMTEMKKYRVIGVIKDYHFLSLHEEIQPLVLYNTSPYGGDYYRMSLRVRPENIQDTIGFLRSTWRGFDSQYPLEFVFLDDQYDALYRAEERLGKLFGYFTALAILIGCLGLFGLSSYSAEQRTKEIGIRKVLGATTSNVTMLLVREFTKWVLLAVLIAWPVGYYIMNTWLRNFAYRIGLGVDTFLLSAVLALVIAIITVVYQAVRAAVANPVDSLKYE